MELINKILGLLFIPTLMFGVTGCNSNEEANSESTANLSDSSDTNDSNSSNDLNDSSGTKILVAYFSATGNTKTVAEKIAEETGGDLYEIIPEKIYTDDDLNYNDDNCRANIEQNDISCRPEISGKITNMDEYDTVIIGHPIWWGEEPRIIDTFMESYDFSGKTIVNFCTSGGSNITTATNNLMKLSNDANFLKGKRFDSDCSSDEINVWLDEIGIN